MGELAPDLSMSDGDGKKSRSESVWSSDAASKTMKRMKTSKSVKIDLGDDTEFGDPASQ